MFFLEYYKDGRIKKLPLNKSIIRIGRSTNNDIILNDVDVSKEHCKTAVFEDHIKITDLDSLNGIYIGNSRVKEAIIKENGFFRICDTVFSYKKGKKEEFLISRELSSIYAILANAKKKVDIPIPETEESATKYDQLLESFAEKAVACENQDDFIVQAQETLSSMIREGCLFYIKDEKWFNLFDWLNLSGEKEINKLLENRSRIRGKIAFKGNRFYYQEFDSSFASDAGCLLFLNSTKIPELKNPLGDFLQDLIEIFEFSREKLQDMSLNQADVPYLFHRDNISIIGTSAFMKRLIDQTKKIAPKSSFILIMGESGTGKELFARMVHALSSRKKYVALNCAAIPHNLLESELFGYESGAFTDARKQKRGKIEEASEGTLVLDEIGDMPLEVQSKLLRAIQEKAITRLGGNEEISVDLRLISITNQDIYGLVETKKFRKDLFFRLRVHELRIPPLRERKEDIPGLIKHFARMYSVKNNVIPGGFSETFRECFVKYDWPGNVRELENEMARIMELIEDHELISDHHILPDIASSVKDKSVEKDQKMLSFKEKALLEERERMLELLEQNDGNKTWAAKAIGMSYRGFLKKLKRLNIS
jgi:DNA-binding NtrC family response regulator